MLALLFLMKGDHNNYNLLKSNVCNYYVNCKYPEKVKSFLKNHIIKNNILNTSWRSFSLVSATLNLLLTAFHDKNNKWFCLLSESCIPLKSIDDINCFLHNYKYSFFHLKTYDKHIYKTSQWWILNRKDVSILLKQTYYTKVKSIITKNNNLGTPDELYFLTYLLMNDNNYKFNSQMTTYVRFIETKKNYHPFTFNYLTKYDLKISKTCLFLRKCESNIELYKPKEILFITFVGKETYNYSVKNTINYNKICDIIVLSYDKYFIIKPFKQLIGHIKSGNNYKKVIFDFIKQYKSYFKQWNKIIFYPEYIYLKNLNLPSNIKYNYYCGNDIFLINSFKNKIWIKNNWFPKYKLSKVIKNKTQQYLKNHFNT